MSSVLQVYRDHVAAGTLSVDQLVEEGHSPGHAHVILHRLKRDGAAVAAGPGRVRLLPPGEQERGPPREPPWMGTLKGFTCKRTGFGVLPRRYGVARPQELVLPPGKVAAAADLLRRSHPGLRVSEAYDADADVCLHGGRVRGRQATVEEALVHVYRHAPRSDFALALQAVLMTRTGLNWDWLRRRPEWPELAGVFVAVNEQAGRSVFPVFRCAEAPDLSYHDLGTVAQPFTARGS